MLKLIRTTFVGGVIFLIPIAILVAVIGQGLKIAGVIAKPVAAVLPVNMIGGVAVAQVLAIVLLLLVCFGAGLLARVALARKAVGALEANVLSGVPAYALLKTKTQSMLSPEDIEGMSVVVMRFDDAWQIGFEISASRAARSRSSCPARPTPGPARSASRRRTASRPSICPWPPSRTWQDGLAEARRGARGRLGSTERRRLRLKPARPSAARRPWAAPIRRTFGLLMRPVPTLSCAEARLRQATARLPWNTLRRAR